jgi:hypothetical protein
MISFDLTQEQQELKALARRFSEQEIMPRDASTTKNKFFRAISVKRPLPRD